MYAPGRAAQLSCRQVPSSRAAIRRASAAAHRIQAAAQRGSGRSSSRRPDDDDDEVGWWEKPNAQADSNPLDALSPWQTRRLEQAYAVGRRKVQVSALAKELDVDRSIVTEWFKRFSKLPDSEQAAIVAARRREVEWEESRAKAKAAAAAEGQRGAKAKAEQPDVAQQGFIPFKVRKTQPRDKKLRQDVLRTLEMVYERTPFPPDDVIRSLWDLHKIPKSTAIEWFKSKRQEMQGDEEQAAAPAEPAAAQKPNSRQANKVAKQARQPSESAGAAEPASSSRARVEPAAAGADSRSTALASTSQPASTAAAQAAAAAKPKKNGRFDDVKIVVTETVDPSSEDQLTAPPPPTADETMENLVMTYGELLVKAAQKDDIDKLMGAEQPDSWADAWRWHRQKQGAARWKPLNWSGWWEQLGYSTDADVDEELLELDRS